MRPRWQRTTRRETPAVDVTAFLSLMVVLIPFLLITAVFSRMTILELQAPSGENRVAALPDPLQLQIIVRENGIEVHYRGQKTATHIPRALDEQALASLEGVIDELKARFPQSLEATILLEPQISYEYLVHVMDVVRMHQQRQDKPDQQRERFPLIALGEVAPLPHQPDQGER
jgi:biopolymer transport protein ExbD